MKKNITTIKDIAAALNLSTSTVSRALTDHPDVGGKTKKAVLKLAAEMEYQPNNIALSLKHRKTNIIGVIIPETENKFFSKTISGIQEVASRAGYNIMICQSHESANIEKDNLQTLVSSRVDGLIVALSAETTEFGHFKKVYNKGIPIVFFDRICDDLDTPKVVSDNFDGSYNATQHLIDNGCGRIAHIAGPQNLQDCRRRYEGYLSALQKNNIPIDKELIVFSDFQKSDIKKYTLKLLGLPAPPDAIMAINDSAAIEMMHIIKNKNLKIPEDIAMVGFNNDHVSAFVSPPLTSLEFHPFEIGQAAGEMLLQQLNNDEYMPEKKVINSRLKIRASSKKGK